MSINLTLPSGSIESELKPRITVIGVGGAGGNAVNNMISSGLEGVEFLVANSDAQALSHSKSERRIQMGINITQGLGAGANPDIGRAAAEESMEEIISHMRDANMVFITAGLGGGTGTGAAPVIAKAAREYGILTVGVVTKPFQFEGANRMKMAEAGLEELQQYVDTLLIIPNQNLFRVANEKTTFADAFKMADDVLYSGVRGVTDLMVMPGLINLDFADIKSVMGEMGKAMMGTGEAEGERRATEAAEQAIANPLLDDISMSGAKGVLINITAGSDITLFEVDEAANRIRDEVDGDSNIIFGSTFDETLEGRVRVSVVATGIESVAGVRREPAEAEKIAPPAAVAPVNMIPRPEEVAIEPEIEPEPIAEEPVIGEAPLPEDDKIPTFLSNIKKDDDVFIPTEPAVTTGASETEMPADPFAAADMVNAHKEPEVKKTPKKSGLSLFERVTGVARGDKKRAEVIKPEPEEAIETVAEVPPEPEPILEPETEIVAEAVLEPEPILTPEPVVEEPVAEKIEIEPVMEAVPDPIPEPLVETAEESVAETVVESPAEMPAGAAEEDIPPPQNLLGDLDSEDRLTGAQDEEDILDIPAFLRRQAN
ncbi:MAG: cell division protein FtsZ [Rhodospirillales bacterium]|nr:cell division protein FtsZ [Rhodospirillales bacterium]